MRLRLDIEALIARTLVHTGEDHPEVNHQHLSAARALRELGRIRAETLDADGHSTDLVTRRSSLQARILAAVGVDTAAGTAPASADAATSCRCRGNTLRRACLDLGFAVPRQIRSETPLWKVDRDRG